MSPVPIVRIRVCNGGPTQPDRSYVLYWMIGCRRLGWNFALDRALEWALLLGKPLLIFEPLRVAYPHASDRLHRFVIDGMADNAARCSARGTPGLTYYPYVESTPDADRGLLAALARQACVVVTDDYPAFFLPRMIAATAGKLDVRMEAVDSNGLLPLRAANRVFTTAYSFRRFLQKELPAHLLCAPARDPLKTFAASGTIALPADVRRRWPAAAAALLGRSGAELERLPINHAIPPVAYRGGTVSGRAALRRFLKTQLVHYAEKASDPDAGCRSGLSPYLHFGHVSTHEIVHSLARAEEWDLGQVSPETRGKRQGWWNMSPSAESFLDQLITWRELGYNHCAHADDGNRYESLPEWARRTLAKHARDPRDPLYSLAELEGAATHDPVWNAAQNQLRRDGFIHNYLRMLWGKKILEWSPAPEQALAWMITLNDRHAVDGRDPNSYSGIFWVLGRYDRPWGLERPIFGTIRYMSSDNTLRKFKLKRYLAAYGAGPPNLQT